jgi:hypothetical protein
MPCNSEYLDPNYKEIELQRTAKLLMYVRWGTGKHVSELLSQAAADRYCKRDYVEALCSEIKGLNTKEFDDVVYNARDKDSRALADWWESHIEADRKREAKEQADTEREITRRKALAKLTQKERIALGL